MSVKVFVHGVPDTPAMWAPLLAVLDLPRDDVAAVRLPGFGAPLPNDFAATKEAYAAWLIAALEPYVQKSGPVDLVGHDWGALLSVRVVHQRPDLIRTWTVSNALPDPAYRWHQAARAWQTPVLGELAMWLGAQRGFVQALIAGGMPASVAAEEAQQIDVTMRRAILRLYRSAVNVGAEWGGALSGLAPRGLIFWGDADPFVERGVAERFSARWGVPLHIEPGAGHWALIERPRPAAEQLQRHWA
jgi:pimeloyl-ACP methyl ester carboxylesterase